MVNLNDFLVRAHTTLSVAGEIWLPSNDDALENFIRRTRNPYLANILISIDARERAGIGTISLDDAIRKIYAERVSGAMKLVGHIDAADVWGAGTARGFWETGAYCAIDDISTNMHSGASIGSHPSLNRSLKLHGPRLETVDTSQKGVVKYSGDLRNAIAGMKSWEKGLAYLRGRYGEAFLNSSPMREFLMEKFGNLKLGQLHDWSVPVCNYSNGNGKLNVIIYNPRDHPDALVVDVLMKTTAVPRVFPLQRESDTIYADGGLHSVFPIETVGDADLIFGFVLTYHLPQLDGKKFNGFNGELRQHARDFAIMQKRGIERDVEAVARSSPTYIAEHGDRYGKLILFMPDLSGYSPEDFYKAEELIDPAKVQTRKGILRFLDPGFKHRDYDENYFLDRVYLSRSQYAKQFISRSRGSPSDNLARPTLRQVLYEWGNNPHLRILH